MDADFNDFGLRIVATEGEAPRKYRSRQFILQQNPWLKNRLFFGTNLRADIATVMEMGLAANAHQAAKWLGCSRDAAYRNWRALSEAGWPEDYRSRSAS